MSNKTFRTGYHHVPKQTEKHYLVWKRMIHWVLIVYKDLSFITGDRHLPPRNSVAINALEQARHDQPNKGIELIYIGCWVELFPFSNDIEHPVLLREVLRDQLDNGATNLVCTQVLGMFTTSWISPEKLSPSTLPHQVPSKRSWLAPLNISPMAPWRHTSSLCYLIDTKWPSECLKGGSPPPQPRSIWMRSVNISTQQPKPRWLNMCPPELLLPSETANVASSAKPLYEEMDEKMDAKITNAHTATWTIIPLKRAETENRLKMTQSMAIQTPPWTPSKHATIGFSQDTLRLTATTSNVPAIKSKRRLHHLPLQEIMT